LWVISWTSVDKILFVRTVDESIRIQRQFRNTAFAISARVSIADKVTERVAVARVDKNNIGQFVAEQLCR
jgi:hypothetical protein